MLYPQNGDRIVTIDSVTSLHPVYSRIHADVLPLCCLRHHSRQQGTIFCRHFRLLLGWTWVKNEMSIASGTIRQTQPSGWFTRASTGDVLGSSRLIHSTADRLINSEWSSTATGGTFDDSTAGTNTKGSKAGGVGPCRSLVASWIRGWIGYRQSQRSKHERICFMSLMSRKTSRKQALLRVDQNASRRNQRRLKCVGTGRPTWL